MPTAHSINLDRNFINLVEDVTSVSNIGQVRALLRRLTVAYELSAVAYVAINLPGSAIPGSTGVERYVSSTYPELDQPLQRAQLLAESTRC